MKLYRSLNTIFSIIFTIGTVLCFKYLPSEIPLFMQSPSRWVFIGICFVLLLALAIAAFFPHKISKSDNEVRNDITLTAINLVGLGIFLFYFVTVAKYCGLQMNYMKGIVLIVGGLMVLVGNLLPQMPYRSRIGFKLPWIVCDLLRAGDAWAYEPYECFDVVYPDGNRTSFGRIARSGVTWDEEFQIFSVNSDVDEGSTRSEDISLDYDFFHSHLLELSCGNDYTAKVIPRDINVWTARLFLGDADGFSILYYQDVDSLVYWANEAAYRWGLRGIAIWSLGQEDMRLWEVMPKQI